MSSKHPHSVTGFGEVILDHVWRPTHEGGVIVATRGGGSVFNILANLAQQGWQSILCGVAGLDEAGQYAVDDLASLGVDIGQVALQTGRRTRLIFEALTAGDNLQVGGMAHAFTTKCPVCEQRIRDRHRPTMSDSTDAEVSGGRWVIYDQLTRVRVAHAQRARRAGATTVLDLGAVSYLRYQPIALILSYLREFDLVFINQRVAASLTNRIGVPAQGLGALLAETIIVVTQGPHGAVVADAGGFSERLPAPQVSQLVDDSGAGDALCSYTLDYLAGQHAELLTAATVAAAVGHAQGLLMPVLTQVGARGHLPPAPSHKHFDHLQGQTLDELAVQTAADRQCALCGLPIQSTTDADANYRRAAGTTPRGFGPGARRNTSLLLNRMLAAVEHPSAIHRAAEVLGEQGTAHVVGSGGSLPAATYISELLNAYGHFAAALTPGNYLTNAPRADTVIAVSYSGASNDIRYVIRAAKQLGVHRIVLLTGARKPALADEMRPLSADIVLSYGPFERGAAQRSVPVVRERGFVSIAGTVTPCIPWLAAAAGINTVVDLVAQIRDGEARAVASARTLAELAATASRLNVVYGPGALPAALDVESKFTESGLPAVSMHEQKDLSHGRFVSVLQPPLYRLNTDSPPTTALPPALILATGQFSKYQQAIDSALHDAHVPVAEIRSTTVELAAPLELLTLVQFFSQAFGSELNIDISRPKLIPEAGLRLYRWRGRPR